MPTLTTTDLDRVLTLADELLHVRAYADLGPSVLAGVARAVGSDTATLTHLDLRTGHEVAVLWPPSRPVAALSAYPALGHTHPLRRPVARAAAAGPAPTPVRITDVMPTRQWQRSALRVEAMPDVTDQMSVALRTRGPVLHALTLGRQVGTFTDRQLTLLARGSTHVRAAVARAGGNAVALQLAPHPEWVSLREAPGLAAEPRPEPRADAPRAALSDRERQVLDLVAQGFTDAQVGRRLGISTATVSRHLHRVYRRHGLANRAAAIGLIAGP